MKTWVAMYVIIWLAFLEIIQALFLHVGYTLDLAIHSVLGVGILAFAFYVQRKVRQTPCPDRIKRITRTTWSLAVVQALLGVGISVGVALSWGSLYATVMEFLHVAIALAIITQASSSATAFDMWEEKEFQSNPAS